MKPGKVAVARVSIRKANGSPIEKAYRVVIDQVPVRRNNEKTGVKVLTRYLTSIYLKPQAKPVEDFAFVSGSVDKNSINLRAKNAGNMHKVLLPSSIVVTKANNETITIDKRFEPINILPNKEVDIVLPMNTDVLQNAKLISFTNTCITCGKETYEVELSK